MYRYLLENTMKPKISIPDDKTDNQTLVHCHSCTYGML